MAEEKPQTPEEIEEARTLAFYDYLERAEAYFKEKFGENWRTEGPLCPFCGERQWFFLRVVDLRIPDESAVYPMAPLVCDNCGYAAFFAAKAAGILESDS